MTRPPCEVADVIRLAGGEFFERYRESLTWAQSRSSTPLAVPDGRSRRAS